MQKIPSNRPQKPTQVHYHYHYHCSHSVGTFIPSRHIPQTEDLPSVKSESHLRQPQSHFQEVEYTKTKEHSGDWKKMLNPEVSRMYANFLRKRSETNDLIKSKTSIATQSHSRLATYHQNEETVWATPAKFSRLRGQLSKSRLRTDTTDWKVEEEEGLKSDDTSLTVNQELQAKLRACEKEIARLQVIEEECIFLRKKFVRHLQRKHRKEFKCN